MSLNGQCRCPSGDRGSILILALWVIFMLAMLAVAVGAHIEGRLALARRIEQRTVGYYAARVGVERGIARLLQDTNGWDGLGETWSDSQVDFSNVVSGAGIFSLHYALELSEGGSNVFYGVWDEQSKIDINPGRGRIELIVALLQVAGGLSPDAAARVGESINLARTRLVDKSPTIGGKTGWVDPHIQPGPFRSIYELRWVKGISPEVFDKIRESVTVYGGDRVNLNTASAVVLQSVGVCCEGSGGKAAQSLARKILQFRERGGIFKTYLGSGLVEALGPEARLTGDERSPLYGMAPFVAVGSDHFRGHVEGAPSGRLGESRRIDFVWDRKHHRIEFWHED